MAYANLRRLRFKHFTGPEMFRIVDKNVFSFICALNGKGSAYVRHMGRPARVQKLAGGPPARPLGGRTPPEAQLGAAVAMIVTK